MSANQLISLREDLQTKRQYYPVLLIEDDPVFQNLIQHYLQGSGYKLTVCSSVEHANWKVREKHHKLILCDWSLPGVSGIQFCSDLRKSEASYHYFILLTGKSSEEDLYTGFNAGADDYIAKGARKLEILARLDAGLRIVLLQTDLIRQQKEMEQQSMLDSLTQVYNRRYLLEQGGKELRRAQRYSQPLSLLMCDIDYFKNINDGHGHLMGDRVLTVLAELLTRNIRQDLDWVCRFGGEEFVVVLPNTSLTSAAVVADKLRRTIELHSIETISVTASFGVSCTSEMAHAQGLDSLLSLADVRLYHSKGAGRNIVTSD